MKEGWRIVTVALIGNVIQMIYNNRGDFYAINTNDTAVYSAASVTDLSISRSIDRMYSIFDSYPLSQVKFTFVKLVLS